MSYTTVRESQPRRATIDPGGWTILTHSGRVHFSDTTDESTEVLALRMVERLEEWRPRRPESGYTETLFLVVQTDPRWMGYGVVHTETARALSAQAKIG